MCGSRDSPSTKTTCPASLGLSKAIEPIELKLLAPEFQRNLCRPCIRDPEARRQCLALWAKIGNPNSGKILNGPYRRDRIPSGIRSGVFCPLRSRQASARNFLLWLIS